MTGLVRPDATALVEDPAEAASVHARGFFGTLEGSALVLDRFESVYLSETHRIALVDERQRPVEWPRLFRSASRTDPEFGVRYVVYRDLRQRGYVVRASPPPLSFAVLPRGGVLNKTPARFWVETESERRPFELARLGELVDRAQAAKKLLLLALVDEESDLTYYRVRRTSPSGTLALPPPRAPAEGWLTGDRVVVFDPEAVEALGRQRAYGSRIGDRLEMSLLEAGHLLARGQLTVRDGRSGRTVPEERFLRRARRIEAEFDERAAAYGVLRDRGLVVKTGFKYGSHFRAYPRSPERSHARYLVRALPASHSAPWPEVAGGIRVAQGVRKEFVVASVPTAGPVRFLSIERIRP